MPPAPLSLESVCRLPAAEDNVAIATRRLDVGTPVRLPDAVHVLPHTVLEGHRFAVRPIGRGDPLLSWNLPFGIALTEIVPGEYVCNAAILEALAVRRVEGAHFPAQPNFADHLAPFRFDPATFHPAPPVDRVATPRTFSGFRRTGGRGVGTRNSVVILGTTSRTASFARQLTARLQPLARLFPSLDGIVAIAHTEGGGPGEPNNTAEILRTLAGFIVHPNVGAVLAIDYGVEPITNARLQAFMRTHGCPLDHVPHHFLTLRDGLAAGLAEGERIVHNWLPAVAATRRSEEPLSALRVALQCGGSDAFSGVSGNPLAGAVAHELVRHGGTAVMTETDESMGAEAYLLARVRDLATARAFVARLDGFREKLGWHGLTPESNPSAGNRFRGLYNIALKSLGAVHKKDPRTRLDHVIDYAQPLTEPGFHFMNGPGNDLEGIAGQIGAGCNLLVFVTGNGSVTNFPFVPTLKITTTTRRHELLIQEMDVNAGRYLDGEPMAALAAETFDLVIATASGRKTRGEHAGHSQVSLWRNWRQTDTSRLAELKARPVPDGLPLMTTPVAPPAAAAKPVEMRLHSLGNGRFATERLALVLPTSMCAAQVARLAAERLNAGEAGREHGISRVVALNHSEGCGFGGESMYQLLQRTYRGYVTHPNVALALLLEHGCEKIPNDLMRRQLEAAGLPVERYGWASVQLDGGIEKALGRIEAWFSHAVRELPPAPTLPTDLRSLAVAMISAAPASAPSAAAFAGVAHRILAAGGSVLLAETDPLLAQRSFRDAVLGNTAPRATLAYGQPITRAGLHVVATETEHWTENLTGLAGCGVHLAVGLVADHPQQGHPLIPVIQAVDATADANRGIARDDVDLFLNGNPASDEAALVDWITAVAERTRVTSAMAHGFVDFQLTRGELGLTT